MKSCLRATLAILGALSTAQPAVAQQPSPKASASDASAATVLPPDYIIGSDDVLTVTFWREKDMSADVTVRPDGRISLPLLNDVPAAGLTPEQLRDNLAIVARKYVENPNPTVIVKTINSRKVFITGQVEKPNTYPLNNPTTVLQLIAVAGGLREFVQGKNISVLRRDGGTHRVFRFNYQEVLEGKNLGQNIELKPGDTVVVP